MSKAIFEIYDKNGNLLRKGFVDKDKLSIDIQDDDYRLVLYDERDRFIVYYDGYIQKGRREERKRAKPFVVLRISSKELVLYCNTARHSHHKTVLTDKQSGEKREFYIQNRTVHIPLEGPGDYAVYSVHENGKDQSEEVTFHVWDETGRDIAKLLEDRFVPLTPDHQALLDVIKEKAEELDLFELYFFLVELYKSGETDQKACYDIASVLEDLLNRRLALLNEQEPYNRLKAHCQTNLVVQDGVTDILFYRTDGKNRRFDRKIDASRIKEHALNLAYGELYLIELYGPDGLVGLRYRFMPDQWLVRELWGEEMEVLERMGHVAEKSRFFHSVYQSYSEREKKWLGFIQHKKPSYFLRQAPETETGEAWEIDVPDGEFYKRLLRNAYLVIRPETDPFHPKKGLRLKFSDHFCLDPTQYGLFKSEFYYVWIEDETGNVLTPVSIVSQGDMAAADFMEKWRLDELEAYRQDLLYQIEEEMRGATSDLEGHLSELFSAGWINIHNCYKFLIARLSATPDLVRFNRLSDAILRNWFSKWHHKENFFYAPIVVDRTAKTITFPRLFFDYVIQIDHFSAGGQTVETEYVDARGGPVTVPLPDSDYAIMTAINKDGYYASGYLFLSSFRHNPVLSGWRIKWEVK